MEKPSKQGTMEEYMKFFNLGPKPEIENNNNFTDLNKELHEPIQADSFHLVEPTNASAPTPSEFSDQIYDQVAPDNSAQPLPPQIPRPRPYPNAASQVNQEQAVPRRADPPPIQKPVVQSPLQQNPSPAAATYVNMASTIQQATPIQQASPLNAEKPFDPMLWMSTVMTLTMDGPSAPVDGTLAGLVKESDNFRSTIVDKIQFMHQNYPTMFPPAVFDNMKVKIMNRDLALRNTASSLRDFEKVCHDIARDLASVSQNLSSIGELSVFLAGITPQLQKLNTAGTTLARVEAAIRSANVEFGIVVAEKDRTAIRDTKSQLHTQYKALRDRQQYQLNQAQESKKRVERYQRTNLEINQERTQLVTLMGQFIQRNVSDTEKSSEIVQKILGIETKQTQYLNDSRQFVQSCNIEKEKQNGVAILTRLEQDITEFDGRVNRFLRHVATSRVAPIMTSQQITQMTEVNLSLEDSNNRKDNEIAELKTQIFCQETLITDLKDEMKEKDELISALQQMAEADNLQHGELVAANQNVADAQQRIDDLEQANRDLSEMAEANRECGICQEERDTTEFKVFNPCGHRTCETCTQNFQNCPFCRVQIQSFIPYFPQNA